MRTPSGTVSTYQHLYDSFTHITEEEAQASPPLPDIAPAALLQSIYSLPYSHNIECASPDSTCECILDVIPFH